HSTQDRRRRSGAGVSHAPGDRLHDRRAGVGPHWSRRVALSATRSPMRLPLQSVRARLTLWYSLLLSIPLAVFAVTSYLTFSRALHERTDAFIGDALSVFSREVT